MKVRQLLCFLKLSVYNLNAITKEDMNEWLLACCRFKKSDQQIKYFCWPHSTINLMKNNLQIVKIQKVKLFLK